ncbi:MFS transporter [Microtetraspora malaysiensis]|uniref:MFS transporter n=1 Tax=Microtetraspora malaysiensis TaxID=161358 RepID=UPI003D8EA892
MAKLKARTSLSVLIVGTLLSTVGDSIAVIAMVLDAATDHPSWWVTEVYLAKLLPPLFLAPVLGSLVDRTDAKKAWLLAIIAEATMYVAAMAISGFHARVALIAIANVCAVAAASAAFKLVPAVAGRVGVEKANSGLVTASSIASLIGPAVGGAFYKSAGSSVLLGMNALTFAALCIAVFLVVPSRRSNEFSEVSNPFRGALDGLRVMARSPIVGPLLPILAIIILATSIEGVAGVFYLREVAGNDAVYGLLLSAWALGAIPGSLAGAWEKLAHRHLLLLLGGAFLVGAALFLEAIFPIAIIIGSVFIAGGFGNGAHNVGVRNIIHTHIPSRMHATAWAYFRVLVNTCVVLGYFVGTPGVLMNARTAIFWSGTLSLIATLIAVAWFWSRRRLGEVGARETSVTVAG